MHSLLIVIKNLIKKQEPGTVPKLEFTRIIVSPEV